jgi:hypothetical protein
MPVRERRIFGSRGSVFTVLKGLFSLAGYTGDIMALIPLLGKWRAVEDPWNSVEGIKARLFVLIEAAELVVDNTETTADDEAVAEFKKFVNDGTFIKYIADFFASNPNATVEQLFAAMDSGPDAVRLEAVASEQQITWSKIQQAIKLLLALLALFRDEAASPAASTTTGDPVQTTFPSF